MPLKLEREEQSSINLTPMIDIVFLLIIFFMVSTKFSELNEAERDIAIQVPTVSTANALTSAPRKREINVSREGTITLDQQSVSLAELGQTLSAAHKQYNKLGVVIRGDQDARYQRVADVVATCRSANVTDVNIAVQNPKRR